MESSRGMACGESWADMRHAMAHLDVLVHLTTIGPLRCREQCSEGPVCFFGLLHLSSCCKFPQSLAT